jgi:GT2 family glycosyltransferase
MSLDLAAVVPTLGASPHLVEAIEALGRQGLRTIAVAQGEVPEIPADLVIRRQEALGFAAAVNLGLEQVHESFVAVVNDDAIVQPGWAEALLETLHKDPSAGAVQGANLRLAKSDLLDGRGIAWNGWWQAVQLGDGQPTSKLAKQREQIFGVSATAAIYRRQALSRLHERDGHIFDARLDSYYEDVELAIRLRGNGYRSWSVPGARALHAGSVSGKASPEWREIRIRGNRYPVVAALLGRSFWLRLPTMILRDKWDMLGGGPGRAGSILRGMARGYRLLPDFAHRGRPMVPLSEIRRYRVG